MTPKESLKYFTCDGEGLFQRFEIERGNLLVKCYEQQF